mgnify:CR=1 FL=1|tara:strand:+ start:9414 stop:9791 length:378 start_codon:yes stop_codon:yes gene_type:complete
MSDITLTFSSNEQPSLQVGDIAYYVNPTTNSGFQVWSTDDSTQNDLTYIGPVTSITRGSTTLTIICDIANDVTLPTTSSFILFSKDNSVNASSLLGYYASVKFKNNSTTEAEMFAAACEIDESSK